MPRLIDPDDAPPFVLDELVEALARHPFDARDEASLIDAGPLLARLGRNRHFLADLAIAELKDRCAGQATRNGYGAQVFLLRPANERYLLRANFWPAAADQVTRTSGAAAFFYDLPHDHHFAFLTYGYLGPGYWSDYWERDPDATIGIPGEPAELRFTGRHRLLPGQLMLYRRHVDVHRQLPPDAFSVSLNILAADPAQPWREQYRFDIADGSFAEALTTTASEVLLGLSVHLGNGLDLAERFAVAHPCRRMRVTALDALASADPSFARHRLAQAVDDPDRYVAAHARLRLSRIDAETDAVAA